MGQSSARYMIAHCSCMSVGLSFLTFLPACIRSSARLQIELDLLGNVLICLHLLRLSLHTLNSITFTHQPTTYLGSIHTACDRFSTRILENKGKALLQRGGGGGRHSSWIGFIIIVSSTYTTYSIACRMGTYNWGWLFCFIAKGKGLAAL